MACKIVNVWSLNIKNPEFRGPNKTHPSGMSETAVGDEGEESYLKNPPKLKLWCLRGQVPRVAVNVEPILYQRMLVVVCENLPLFCQDGIVYTRFQREKSPTVGLSGHNPTFKRALKMALHADSTCKLYH